MDNPTPSASFSTEVLSASIEHTEWFAVCNGCGEERRSFTHEPEALAPPPMCGCPAITVPATINFANGGSITFADNPIGCNTTSPIPPSLIQGLDYAFLQVREMVKLFDQPHPTTPTLQPVGDVHRRSKWIREECDELEDATTIEDQADAYMDIIVFALGGFVEIGVLPQALLDIVNAANMAKAVKVDGVLTVVKDAIGKVQKPAGWKENFEPQPRIAAEVGRQKDAGLLLALGA